MNAITLQNLSFYRGNRPVFERLSYTFKVGSFTLLCGDSGSGKSTLLRLIAGFANLPYTGTILLQQQDHHAFSMTEKAQQVGMLFQYPSRQFTMKTLRREIIFALENIGMPANEIAKQVADALKLGKMEDIGDRELMSLSGGEQQQAALTVLLAMDPGILLLDEPFASIDPQARKRLIATLSQLKELGKTIVLCDHDLNGYYGQVDQVVTLSQGQLEPLSVETLAKPEGQYSLSKKQTTGPAILTLEHVILKQGGTNLLQVAEWNFSKGITTLTGPNGSGKSTLLRALVQLAPYQGKMWFRGQRLRKSRHLYRHLSLTVQEAEKQFVALTLAEELAFSHQGSRKSCLKQQEALEVLGLGDLKTSSVYQLSEGQKKMVQLMSMLSLDLPYLLLDEPFTGLDQKACAYFMKWLMEKASYQDFLIVSHRLAPLSGVSDHHVVIANQRLERGKG